VPTLRLTTALNLLLEESGREGGPPLTLGLVIDTTGERAFGVLMAFLCLPFLTPIPLPGVSIPFGLALVLLGAQLALRKHRPWLPERLKRWRLPPKLGPRLISFVARLFRPLEKIVRPRLLFMQNGAAVAGVGVALMVDGFLLSLPLPPVIPGSNAIPAWMALVKIIGLTEEDGASMLLGTAFTAAAAIAIIVAVAMSWQKVMHMWG
jgi:hypothetical protein